MISEHDVIIKPLSVQPFTWDSTCPACGVDSKGWWLAFKRLMYGRDMLAKTGVDTPPQPTCQVQAV